MKNLILITLLTTAPFAAAAHHGPYTTSAQLQGGTPVAVALSKPSFAPALSAIVSPETTQMAAAGN
ncbi:hypothetical protein [Pelagimonas varians]|uniref:Uncharacterized protein n=1 Tax=Pelagimonas varians TaxID=696760 RepID=A0A238K2F0_9RHOB|nr:hypothetical protein [Pelagimonas varians]PYG27054.1 hypothetical protein C8N36_11877 [Pelagimonas varians]SMX37070.1 hypothetical protein PEV8663_00904 [Pelagimonas varians]